MIKFSYVLWFILSLGGFLKTVNTFSRRLEFDILLAICLMMLPAGDITYPVIYRIVILINLLIITTQLYVSK